MITSRHVASAALASLTLSCGGSSPVATTPAAFRRSLADDAAAERTLEGSVLEESAFVRSVLARNPSLESARQAWRGAVARVKQAGTFDDPTVDVGVAPLSIGSSEVPFGFQAGVSQRLPWFGKRALEEAAARAESGAARSDLEASRRDLALSAAVLYDQYFVTARALEVNARHVVLVRELKAASLAQLEAGRGSAQDPLQAEMELVHMEHAGIELRTERTIVVAEMNALLHRDPEAALPPPVAALPPADAAPPATDATHDRPEIDAAKQRATAEQHRAERAERESFPDLTVSTTYNSMWAMAQHRWMVGLGLNLPIELSRRAGAVEEAQAARARYESDVASLSDKIRAEVVVARARLEEAGHVVTLYDERLLPIARRQIDAARAGYVTSRNDFAVVVNAEKSLRSVELEAEIARATLDRRRAELDHALGRSPGQAGSAR